jgi:hypothetical protein
MKDFNKIELALMNGKAKVVIFPFHTELEILFKLAINDSLIRVFPTYTDACQWVINTVNQIKE